MRKRGIKTIQKRLFSSRAVVAFGGHRAFTLVRRGEGGCGKNCGKSEKGVRGLKKRLRFARRVKTCLRGGGRCAEARLSEKREGRCFRDQKSRDRRSFKKKKGEGTGGEEGSFRLKKDACCGRRRDCEGTTLALSARVSLQGKDQSRKWGASGATKGPREARDQKAKV